MCLDSEEMILQEETIMLDNPMPHQKKLWNQRAKAVIKNEELLKQNLRALYAVVMSLCDPIMEDKVSCHKEFARIKCTRNTFKLLQVIKQLKYSNGSKEIHAVHNHVMCKHKQMIEWPLPQ